MKTLPAAILAALILSGCSSATLQFASDPEGAVVRTSGNGSVLGTTPFSVSVDPDSLALRYIAWLLPSAIRLRLYLGVRSQGLDRIASRYVFDDIGKESGIPILFQPAKGRAGAGNRPPGRAEKRPGAGEARS